MGDKNSGQRVARRSAPLQGDSHYSEQSILTREAPTQPAVQASTQIALNLNLPWILRVQSRNQDLCKWFSIPLTERLLDDFTCALRKRALLQGRLFVFENYVCFYANVFGYIEKRVLHIPDVVAIRLRTHFRFPNSIEIECMGGQRDFFTSFLARESAYRLIVGLWTRKSPSLRAYAGMSGGDDDGAYGDNGRPHTHHSASLSDILTEQQQWQDPMSGQCEEADEIDQALPAGRAAGGNGGGGTIMEGADEENEEGGEDGEHSVWSVIEPCDMPARHKDAKMLVSGSVPGSLHDVYTVLLANDSHFLEDGMEWLGNKRIHLQAWQHTGELGHIRDMQFTSPIKGAFANWGVPETRCFVSQRFCQYQDGSLLFESSQTNMDIPYGDCFTVDTRWEMRPVVDAMPGEPAVQVDVYLRVPFSRMCLFKKIIEHGTFAQSKDTNTALLQRLVDALTQREAALQVEHTTRLPPPRASVSLSERGAGGSGMPPVTSHGSLRVLSSPSSSFNQHGGAVASPMPGGAGAGGSGRGVSSSQGHAALYSHDYGDHGGASASALHVHTRGHQFGVFTTDGDGAGAGEQGVLGALASWGPWLLTLALLLTAGLQLYVLLQMRQNGRGVDTSDTSNAAANAHPALATLRLLQSEMVSLQARADAVMNEAGAVLHALQPWLEPGGAARGACGGGAAAAAATTMS
ncbi:hypothetical protein FOA52_006530 [Chlamydomonas sp. UWO 241]|nr:hypothetical protein FOA52_006530 [Chlamydomonas sp. UWO 241]